MTLKVGDYVWKSGTGYSGLGIVRVVVPLEDQNRYIVSHWIGGRGALLHIYSSNQLQLLSLSEVAEILGEMKEELDNQLRVIQQRIDESQVVA